MSKKSFYSFFLPCFLMVIACLLAAPAAFGAVCESTTSGSFHDFDVWDCGSVPQNGDVGTIQRGHTLIAAQNVDTSNLVIRGGGVLEVEGFAVRIQILNLIVESGGTLRGSATVPSRVYVTGPFNIGINVINDGRIVGSPGGHVFIHDQSPGGDRPCPIGSSIQSAGGSFEGGSGRGNVYLLAQHVELHDAKVLGGSGNVPPTAYSAGIAGSVYVSGLNVNIMDSTLIRSGDNTSTLPGAIGGSVKIAAQSCNSSTDGVLVIDDTSVVEVGGPSDAECPGALVYAGQSSTILGTVDPGPLGCTYWDPPDLVLAGNAELTGKKIIVAGENMDARFLAQRSLGTPALDASEVLEINLRPGGALDLRGLQPGFAYFRAGTGITIRADNIVTDGGVSLEDLMTPAPEWLPGAETLQLAVSPDSQQNVAFGNRIEHPLQVTNVGTSAVDVEVWIEDTAGWLQGGPRLIQAHLEPGEPILLTLILEVPYGRTRLTELKAAATIAGKKDSQVSRATFLVSD